MLDTKRVLSLHGESSTVVDEEGTKAIILRSNVGQCYLLTNDKCN